MKLALLTFLLLLFSNGLHAEPLNKAQHQEALQLFTALGCQACHDFNNDGSHLAVSLDRIGLKLDEEGILQRLLNSHDEQAPDKKFMPSYQSTPLEQLKLLSRFLANRK